MSITAKLRLDDFDPFNNGQEEFNKMTRVLDGLLHCVIKHTAYDNPVDAAADMAPGVVFRVSGSASGVWAGEDNNFAIGLETINPADALTYNITAAWNFVTPIQGFIAWILRIGTTNDHRQTFNSSGWFGGALVADLDVGVDSEATTVSRFNSLLAQLRGHGIIAT